MRVVTGTSTQRNGNHISGTGQDEQESREHVTGTGLGLATVTSGSCNRNQADNKTETGFWVEILSYSVIVQSPSKPL